MTTEIANSEDNLLSLRLVIHHTRLVNSRKHMKLNQTQVSKITGIKISRLHLLESAKANPKKDEIDELCCLYQVAPEVLFPDIVKGAIDLGLLHADCRRKIWGKQEILRQTVTDNGLQENEMIRQANRRFLTQSVENILNTLDKKSRKVIECRFGLGEFDQSHTLEETAEYLDITSERVRQIEHKALRTLRHPTRSRRLKDYLE